MNRQNFWISGYFESTAKPQSSTSRSTTFTKTQRERLTHLWLVADNSKEQLRPTGCEIHTSTTHKNKTHSPNFSTSSTAAILISLRDLRRTIVVGSRNAIGAEFSAKTYFPSESLKWSNTESNAEKLCRPSDLFKINGVFLCVDSDFSSLAVKDLRLD